MFDALNCPEGVASPASQDRAFAASPSSLSPQSRPTGLQSHDAGNPVASAIDQLASFETPNMRWLRLASAQLRAADAALIRGGSDVRAG